MIPVKSTYFHQRKIVSHIQATNEPAQAEYERVVCKEGFMSRSQYLYSCEDKGNIAFIIPSIILILFVSTV
jgi:hypothetical protein